MEDVEILSSPELVDFRGGIWSQEQEEIDLSDLPRAEVARLKIRIRSRINIRIRFTGCAVLEKVQLAQDSGSIWIRGSREESIHNGGTIRFSVQELDEVEIKDVEVLPVAKLNPEERFERRNEDATSMLVRLHD